MNERLPPAIQSLIDAWLDDRASDAEIAHIETAMKDPDVAAHVARQVAVHAALNEDGSFSQPAADSEASRRHSRARIGRRHRRRQRRGGAPAMRELAVAALLLIALGVVVLQVMKDRPSPESSSIWAQWESGSARSGSQLLQPGQTLVSGQTIFVTNTSALRLEDGSQVNMEAGTRFKLEQRAQGERIWLDHGVIHCSVTKRDAKEIFQVQTDLASVTVVGTAFTVGHSIDATGIDVSEGRVRVLDHGLAQETLLDAGDTLEVQAPPSGPQPWLALAANGATIEASQPWTSSQPPRVSRGELLFSDGDHLTYADLPTMDGFTAVIRFRPQVNDKMQSLYSLADAAWRNHIYVSYGSKDDPGRIIVHFKERGADGRHYHGERKYSRVTAGGWHVLSVRVKAGQVDVRWDGERLERRLTKGENRWRNGPRAMLKVGGTLIEKEKAYEGDLKGLKFFPEWLPDDDLALVETNLTAD